MKRGLIPGGSAVVMGLIISLAFLGVGYGLWSDTLRISGAVATGSVNAAFSLHELDEGLARGVSGGPTDNDQNEDLELNGLDTAECRARIFSPVASDQPVDVSPADIDVADEVLISRPASDFLYVLLRNAYPSFNCYVDFDVHNVGSVPIKVNQPVLGPVPDGNVLTVEFQNCYDNGAQVEPGAEVLCTLHVHVERGAQPQSVYRFGATICAYQWNAGNVVRCAVPTDVEPLPADFEPVTDEAIPATVEGVQELP